MSNKIIIKPYYSGVNSKIFWNKINKLKNKSDWQEMYSLGVALQNLESFVLKQLKECK